LGKVDFSDTIPVFDFSAFVPKIDLVKLNLNATDSISQATFLLTAKISGNSLDNSKGEIKVVNSSYKNQNGEFKLSDITINADNNKDSKLISLQSEFAEGELRSKYNYANILENLENLLYIYVPALNKVKKPLLQTAIVKNPEFNDYIIKFRLKKTKKLTDVLAPDFRIAENTSIFGIFNPDLKTLMLKIKIPELAIGTNILKDISIDGQTKDSIFDASITVPQINLGKSNIRNLSLSTLVKHNILDFTFGWDNKQTPINKGIVKATADFNLSTLGKGSLANIVFNQSEFVINDSIWSITPSSINLDTANIAIHQFNIHNQNQALSLTGNISSNPKDSIQVNLQNIDISSFNFYLKNIGYNIGGRIGGQAKVTGIYSNPTLLSNISINKFVVNNREIGDVKFTSEWFGTEKRLSVELNNTRNDSTTFETKGNIFTETSKLDFKINISRIFLQNFGPMLTGVVSGLAGSVNGNLSLTGTTSKPLLNGILNINEGKLTIDFMKAPYTINDHITFSNSDIVFNNFRILDQNKRDALVNGRVNTGYFGDFNLNLNISPNNFQCINTTERDNSTFYGTVYATGLVAITGKPDDINMNIAVRTDNKTILFLPLSSSGEVVENNFITFTNNNPDDIFIEDIAPVKEESSTNMNLSFDLQVTPDAEVQIIIDKKLGDIIKANGSGNLKMVVNPNKDLFKIYGDYNIEKGDYLFTLQGVINKKFKIDEGSSLSWNGDPTDATVNIKAIYQVRTPLKDLLQDYTGKYDARVPVNCQILLTQKLLSPGIKFNIDVPNADAETKILVESALNSEDNINRQFLGLLVINSFIAKESGPEIGSGVSNTVSEMLSNQLSNWISQWSKTFDIGINYRPGSLSNANNPNNLNNISSSDQVELALSTQILDDRVSVNGNVNVGNRSNTSSIAGDFNIDIKLNKTGKLRFKAFARSNDETMTTTSAQTYTTGAGIVYREDFNNFNDLIHRIKYTFKQEPVIAPLKDQSQPTVVKDSSKNDSTELINFAKIKK
jgi:autotransporter translocation and assembly factor TamB